MPKSNSDKPKPSSKKINSGEIENICKVWAEVGRAILMRRNARDEEQQKN